ncbi:MAG: aminopeptidase [Actinomycetia bacterium]|nr:aminopeptidase [Actinomycetes bacterium]
MTDQEFAKALREYAALVIRSGCNIQTGQELMIAADVDSVEFVRLLTAEAYELGAKRVTVRFGDTVISRMNYQYGSLEQFEQFPEWLALLHNSMANAGAAVLMVDSSDPLAMAGVDPMKMVAYQRAAHVACNEYYAAMDAGRLVWCIVGAAASGWASRVFPDKSQDEALRSLWQVIFKTVRVDGSDSSQKTWQEHRASFIRRATWLNDQCFDSLHYSNSLGTDLTVGLNQHGIWKGGGDTTVSGLEFFPNMPTEEIFTTPDFRRVEGVVYSSMPLAHNGQVIEDFSIRFVNGIASECQAKRGLESLQAIIATDDGAKSLGECALVPWTSPIREAGILFYSTLYDENASCHLALGTGFPDCLLGGTEMGEDELKSNGVNKSATHVDFMIGTQDMSIVGIKADGSRIPIFVNGEWSEAVG